MVPTPQELGVTQREGKEYLKPEETVVISGMSGLFPDSKHVKDLADILYSKKNPVSSNPRWKCNHPEVAQYAGRIPDLELFDAQFFKVHYRLGHKMDPVARKVLELAYQAIYDAGVNPEHFWGKKVGVYIGTCFSETEKSCFYVANVSNGFGIAGCNKSMFANRISYWLNIKGPSINIDSCCCSSITALELAYLAMTRGDCEAAIVGGGNVCLHPQSSVHSGRTMTISVDGKTKSFDENASGCAKTEAINVLFLQKAKDALRVYADVVHVKCEYQRLMENKTGPRFGFCRDPIKLSAFLKNFYKEAKVSPQAVEYVEAFGSALPEADKSELDSIDAVFCNDRKKQLLVGSVMSNIGYGEAASGISAVIKVLLGYHRGELAANLYCETPRRDIEALREGRMRIVTEHQPFDRTYTAVNGLSITGINSHTLLHGHYKPKDLSRYKSNIPHLVAISARQDSSVKKVLDDLKSRPIDPEELALLHNIHQSKISGHVGRGFTILDTNADQQTISLCEKVDYFDNAKRPLWFVYSGMGSQWAGMGTQLMRIPIFAAAIERCRQVLEPKGVDIVHIITSPDKSTFDHILNSFVGIAAIQIGLTDILWELGLVPDKIIGHSVGELGCAYADGCFTAEEMILAAYYRGLVSVQTPFIRGSMAAVGIGYQEILKMCPPSIEVACHNGPDSSTISGPANVMGEFVAQLTAKNIFAKEVPCSNIAYHSRYIAEAGPKLLKHLSEVIKSPKLRSEKWVSTSVPQEKWNEPMAKYSSAEYHTNNLLNSVLFEETSRLVPSNAVLVEIAPHGLLQAILKRSLADSCQHIPLTRRGHTDNVQHLLEAIGKLFMEGYNPKVQALYPKIEFPVSTGTPLLSHLVEWAHHEKWDLPLYASANRKFTASCKLVYSIHDVENNYLTGNVLRGKNTFPFAAALIAVWDVLAMTIGVPKKQLSVQYHDVKLYSQPNLHYQRQLRLLVSFLRGTGYFEVMDDYSKIATGYIEGDVDDIKPFLLEFTSTEELNLKSVDIYQLLHNRGYDYSGQFQSIHSANRSLTEAKIYCCDNWVTFLDGMLQLIVLKRPHHSVSQPTNIRNIIIDIKRHFNSQEISVGDERVMTANVFEIYNSIRCGGVAIEDVKFRDLPPLEKETDLMTLKFVPYFQQDRTDFETAMLVYLQIVAENLNKNVISILELCDHKSDEVHFRNLNDIFKNVPFIEVQHKMIYRNNILYERANFLIDVDLMLVTDLSKDDKEIRQKSHRSNKAPKPHRSNTPLCQTLYRVLCRDTFILNKENYAKDLFNRPSALYRIVSAQNTKDERLELVRWRPTSNAVATSTYTVRSSSDLDLLSSTQAALPQRHKLLIITSYPPIDGLKNLVQQWRKDRIQIYVIMINYRISEDQNIDQLPNLDLAFNVLDHGQWGGQFFIPLQKKISFTYDITLQNSSLGDFNSLYWVEMPRINGPGVKVTVHFAGLNDNDVKKCAEIIPRNDDSNENNFGMDFSGVTESGERVMGLVTGGAVSSRVLARPDLLWPVPEHWSLEEAATVPLAYCLAFYCLAIKYNFLPGMTVLVHGGAGALGQAVISIALGLDCKIFTTVSDINKKRFLRKLFPELKDDQIGNSRDSTFADMVLTATNGNGCDIVISCISGDLKHISLKCTASWGVTIDTAQITTQENFYFGMHGMDKQRSYIAIHFSQLLAQESNEELRKIQLMVSEGIKRGYVRPLSRVIYAPMEVSRAFRLLAASRHRGRALIQLLPNDNTQEGLSPYYKPRLSCSSDLSQLIFCNNNNLGLQFAKKIVNRGARKVYLHSLKHSEYLEYEIRSLVKHGVQVKLTNEILKSENDITNLLNDCNNLGVVEGIYIVGTNEMSDTGSENLVRLLDLVSRKLCPHIKYFGVLSINVDTGLHVCISRAQDRLPVTLLKVPAIKKMGVIEDLSTNEMISEVDAINTFERALRYHEPIIFARVRPMQSHTLLDKIANVAGIEVPADVAETATLSDLDFQVDRSKMISTYLSDVHNISISEEAVSELTIQKIREIDETINDMEFEDTKDLDTFYSHVDLDELLATTEMVFLPTLANSSDMRDDELDVSQTYLCIIPGLEGHHVRFRILCERLKVPAIILQPGLDRSDETISNLAQRYAEILLKKAPLKENFYLLGYESGSLVALEMAAILEDHGLTGTVFFVGESPEEIQSTIKERLKEYNSDEALQIAVAKHIVKLMVGGASTDELAIALCRVPTWQEKVEECLRFILGRVSHSVQYMQELIESAYGRIKQVLCYDLKVRALRSKLILIRAASSAGNPEALTLQSHSQQPISIYQLRAPLAYTTEDLRCSAVINSHLNTEILEAFEKKNLCDTYLLNADVFAN
ncbi:unnamed protein product [Parnassius apollo]|uniref:(apollo) hypothetical protein n=1 Tax=Parnassius apollo TaxID=110799 RepID=A0A8S3XHZ0_PARAO|nr:unnamed protein product [Parnassius apollo]